MFKIIAIDDNPVVVESLKDIIPWESLGFSLEAVFTNSQRAMDYLAQNHIDAVLSDIAMEEPDGLEIVKICNELYPHIKIILLSAFRNFEYAREAIRYPNVQEYLTKPLDFSKLCDALSALSQDIQSDEIRSDFTSGASLDRRLEFFSNLMCQYIVYPSEIDAELASLNIRANALTTPCSVVTLHIENFDKYIETIWKYSTLQLYYAISNSLPFETRRAYYSLANYAYGNIVWMIIHKTSRNTEETVEDFEKALISNLGEFLKISVSVTSRKTYPNICELVSNANLTQSKLPNENATIAKALEYMNENYAKDLSMKMVADYVFMSSSYFSTYFKKITGEKFIDMLTRIRITNAARYLEQKNLSINEVCEMVGYNHIGNFYEKFKKIFNMTPAEYKSKFVRDDE